MGTQGKLSARERLQILLDPESLVETGVLGHHRATAFGMQRVEAPGDGVITGYGRLAGRTVCVAAEDFAVMGGSIGEMHAGKVSRILELALRLGVPFIQLNESGGARIQEGVVALDRLSEIFRQNTLASGVIPQISVVFGPAAGGAVYSPALTDFTVMTRSACMFVTGPDVIRTVTHEEVSFEDLGGGEVHNRQSGVAHFLADDDRQAIALVRELLGYLPDNNASEPPAVASGEPPRPDEALRDLIPRDHTRAYDIKQVIARVSDAGQFLEIQAHFAPNVVVGFARLRGRPVGVVANQPRVMAGTLDVDASDKAARFVRTCDAFNLPLVTLVDIPGYLPGTDQEHRGLIRHGAKLLYAYAEASVPKLTVILRKAVGGGYIAMSSRGLGADYVLALPDAEVAVLGAEGAANILLKNGQATPEEREAFLREYREELAHPYHAARRGVVDDVIDASEIRPRLIAALEGLRGKTVDRPVKKHGNIPL